MANKEGTGLNRDKNEIINALLANTEQFESLYAEYFEYTKHRNKKENDQSSNTKADPKADELFRRLKKLVRDIELARQDFDKAIGFNIAQEITHDLVFRFDSFNPGQVSSNGFITAMQNIETLIKSKHPNIDNLGGFDIVSITTGSGSLCTDLMELPDEPKTTEDSEQENDNDTPTLSPKSVLADIQTVMDAAGKFATDSITPPKQKLKKFQNETGVSDEELLKVYGAYVKTQPKKKEKQPLLSLNVNGGVLDSGKQYSFTPELHEIYSKAYEEVKELVKKPDQFVIIGELRQMEHWEKAHKIQIAEAESKKKFILNFDERDTEKVKEKIGTTVSVQRSRISGNSWMLEKWL